MKILLAILLFSLSSCVSPDMQMRLLKSSGTLKFEMTDVAKEQAKVSVVNKNDYDWNAENPAARSEMVNQLLNEKCISYKILREKEANTGAYAQGRPAITWTYTVQCKPFDDK